MTAKTEKAMRGRAAERGKAKHSEERPGMGCGDPACKEHYPLPKAFPIKEASDAN